MGKMLRIAVIGAGVRGTSLARKVLTSGMNAVISAVAEPDPVKRNSFAHEFKLPADSLYPGWEEMEANPDKYDAAIIATLDNQHTGPAMSSLRNGWHILIEKPLADTFSDCQRIVRMQKEKKKVIAVCHTLRFMHGYKKVKKLCSDGAIGELVHIEHMEAISNIRFAHNYVRGRWSQEKLNTFLLLHKCSHDIDYISWLFDVKCLRVSSFGSLKYFTRTNAPEGSTLRCTDGCTRADTCPYSALNIYIKGDLNEWPARDISNIHTEESHLDSVKNGPYGICVWYGQNDVVDHQVVMIEFEGGATATCTLTGYSATNGRRIRLQGTKGEIVFDEASGTISIREFYGTRDEIINITPTTSYHPEDQDIVNEWLSSVLSSASVTVDASEALRTHAVVFAAELSRREKRTVEMSELLQIPED
ncbi:MAG TPA: Gfo/Idh/MocA family oxidoreductase [Bacteroidales bacterium]|nr:Gfo/Idh/MocA family oxidoreductase [Bacteroidales bacterium]